MEKILSSQVENNNLISFNAILPVAELKDSIIIPFYFNHNRFTPISQLNTEKFKNNLKGSINSALNVINNKLKLNNLNENRLTCEYFEYKESYEHIDFLNRKHPFSFAFKFNENDYISDSFIGFDLHIYHDQEHDNINGGINLHIKPIKDFKFDNVLKQVYLSNFIEYFIENYFIVELAKIYPDLFITKTINRNDKPIVSTKIHEIDIFHNLKQDWENLVHEKFNQKDAESLNNDFFYSLLNSFLLIVNLINIVRITVVKNESISFQHVLDLDKFNMQEEKLHDFNILFKLLENYSKNDFNYNLKEYKDLTHNDYKIRTNRFTSLKISFYQFYYLHNIVFKKEVRELINNLNEEDNLTTTQINMINFIINSTLNSEKFMLSIKSKLFISWNEFTQISHAILNDEEFNKENKNNVISSRFYNNNHFAGYNKDNYLLLAFIEDSIDQEAKQKVNYFYALAFIYFGASYVGFKEIENYAEFVIASGYNHKNFSYRRIVRDLRVIGLDLYNNLYGINGIKYIVKQIDSQYHLHKGIDHLIEKVRKEDEADKLIVERNSIATAFICALFVGIVWFIDQCFASLQSFGTGIGQGHFFAGYTSGPGMPNGTIPMPVIFGFVGTASFVILVITLILAYQCIKIYVTFVQTKNRGLQNIY